jgi:hypothetical protein
MYDLERAEMILLRKKKEYPTETHTQSFVFPMFIMGFDYDQFFIKL